MLKIKIMDEKEKNLNFWHDNAEEDFLHTPICVLRYISELEKEVEKLTIENEKLCTSST